MRISDWSSDVCSSDLSIRQLYQHVLPARGHVLIKGDPAQVADVMEEWYRDKACDGFNIVAPYLPGGLEGIVDLLVPELQRRGLFRTEYEGRSEEHTSELQSLMRISYAVLCLKKKKEKKTERNSLKHKQ